MTFKRPLISLFMILLAFSVLTNAQQNVCDGVLKYAGRNISSQSNERDRRSYVYQQLCRGRYQNSQGSVRVGLDAVIESVPVGFSFGSDNRSSRVTTFCSENVELATEESRADIFSSQVYGPAIDAWESCILANTSDFRIEPILIDDSNPLFGITNRLIGTGVDIRRVQVSNKSTSCTIAPDRRPAVTSTFESPAPSVRLAQGEIANIICQRKSEPRMIDGTATEYTPEVSVSILTSQKNYQILLPAKKAILVSENKMNAILNRLADLESKSSFGSNCMRLNKTQICWGKVTVSAGSAAWVRSFWATFEKPFADTPMITHGLNTHGNGAGVAVTKWNPSKTGFSGITNNMHTVNDANPGVVTMDYIAVGKAVD